MAYRLLQSGRHKARYRKEKGSVPILTMEIDGKAVIVTNDEVKGYVNDPSFGFYLQCWQYTKLWGTLDWREWPIDILEGMTAIECETKAIESEEMEKARAK